MITLMRKALDCLERKGATLKCWQVHLQQRMELWRSRVTREYTKNPLKRLLRKVLMFQSKRRMRKQFRRFQKPVLMGYNIKFQRMDELEKTGEIQVKFKMKLKDGTEVALTDRKKSKGSLSCSL